MFALIFLTNFVWNIFNLVRNELNITRNVHRSPCKGPVVLVTFERKLNFLHRFSKNLQISNFMKICPVGGQLFHADRRRDRHGLLGTQAHRKEGMKKLIVIFRKYTKVPKVYHATTRGDTVPYMHSTPTVYDATQNANQVMCRNTEHFEVQARMSLPDEPAICRIFTAESDRNVIQMFCKRFPHASSCSSNYRHLFHLCYLAYHTFVYFNSFHHFHYICHNRQNSFYLFEFF